MEESSNSISFEKSLVQVLCQSNLESNTKYLLFGHKVDRMIFQCNLEGPT